MALTLYIARHGESVWNVERRVQGQLAAPGLTSLGRTQARAAASKVAALGPIDRLITSDLTRAVETAAAFGRPLVLDARLREQAMGVLEGKLTTEAFEWWTDATWTDDDHLGITGESTNEVTARVSSLLRELIDDERATTVLVSHGGAIRAAIGWLIATAPGGRFPRDPETIGNGQVVSARLVDGVLVELVTLV